MAYEKQTWVNRQSQANATRLSHIEDGIYNAYMTSLIAITNIQPSECNEGDKYFNTSDNLIYTATDTDTWSETGETPISDKTYVLLEDGSTYMYDGTTLTRIGGSEQEVENEYSESTVIPYSCDYVNNLTKLISEPQYCHATSSGEQVPTTNYYVQLSVFDRKNGNFTFENGGIRIGEGIHTIAVSGSIFIEGWTGGSTAYYVWGRIYKNSGLINGMINSGGAPFISCSLPSVIIPVSEGDVIKLMADNSAVNTTGTKIRNGGANTYLDIFVIN